jgi:TatD DNase family protein
MPDGLVDFHCHLDLYPDHAAAVAECERAGVFTLAVTTTPKAWPRNQQVVATTRHVRAALGIHPQLVAERAAEMDLWATYLREARYVGEVGLDGGPRFFRSMSLQKQVFEQVLRLCARQGGKVLTVHSARATKAVLDLIEEHLPPPRGRVVLHWFTGTRAEARRAVDLGCFFSVNTPLMRSERHQPMVAELPLGRLLPETDGPFAKINNRVVRPGDVADVMARLARARNMQPSAVAESVRENLRSLLTD